MRKQRINFIEKFVAIMVPFLFLIVLFMVISPGLKAAVATVDADPEVAPKPTVLTENTAVQDSIGFFHRILFTNPGKMMVDIPGFYQQPDLESSHNESGFLKMLIIRISPVKNGNNKVKKGTNRDVGL